MNKTKIEKYFKLCHYSLWLSKTSVTKFSQKKIIFQNLIKYFFEESFKNFLKPGSVSTEINTGENNSQIYSVCNNLASERSSKINMIIGRLIGSGPIIL